MAREEEGELLHGIARERSVWGEWEGERERAGRWFPGEEGSGGRVWPEGRTWRPDSARMTRTRDALADRPRVSRGLSAGGVTWQ